MPLVPVLAEMEMNGVRLDVRALGEVQRELEGRMNAALSRLQQEGTEEAAAAYSRLHDSFESGGSSDYYPPTD